MGYTKNPPIMSTSASLQLAGSSNLLQMEGNISALTLPVSRMQKSLNLHLDIHNRKGTYTQYGPYEPHNNGVVTGSSCVGESTDGGMLSGQMPTQLWPVKHNLHMEDDEAVATQLQEIYSGSSGSGTVWGQISGGVSGQSWPGSHSSLLADDAAIAKTLQEMEYKLGCMALYDGPVENLTDYSSDSQSYSTGVGRQDDVDLDNMSYEEIGQLGQSMGAVNPGLSLQAISRLPIHNYKPSRRKGKSADNDTDCVICKMEYKDGDRMITLPCAHQYHESCITNWFKENKNCCVCKQEVDI